MGSSCLGLGYLETPIIFGGERFLLPSNLL
jgi:hypothetical protein